MTTLSSHITYANAAFIRNSGFATGIIAGQAVAQLDEMTQQNTAMVEQSSASANSMGDRGPAPGGGGQGVFGVIAAPSAFTPHANA